MSQQQIDQIRDAVRELTDFFQSHGIQNFSDTSKTAFANFLDQAADRVAELRSQLPPTIPQIPNGAEMLWQIAGAQPDAFVNYLRTVPDPALNALITRPDQLNSIIDHLSRVSPPGIPITQDGIQSSDLESSNIWGYKYNPRNRRLLVRFNSGSIYGYDNVPQGIFDIFKQGAVPAKTNGQNQFGKWWQGKQPSLGAAFYQMVRMGGYPYQRLS